MHWSGPWGFVGRVWPRHEHRGRPLNAIVRRQLIDLPFTVENARSVIASGAKPISPYTHRDIANWCERFWNQYCDVDAPPDIERIMPVLADVETQWDLYLAHELRKNPAESPDQVKAPHEWFLEWSNQIDV